jgi:hypothetical protein
VPKRTREIGGNSNGIVEDLNGIGIVVANGNQTNGNIVLTNIRVNTPASNPTSSAPSPFLSSTQTSQMCSTTTTTPPIDPMTYITTDIVDVTHQNFSNNNNNNNINCTQDLSVYDVIYCISQAHRSHCTYTESATAKSISHQRPLAMPNSSASLISSTSIASPVSVTEAQSQFIKEEKGVSNNIE